MTFELTKVEKEACSDLWNNLIKDWTILKSTSIETLQQNFISRSGTINVELQTIDVYLENSNFDILLEHYPYNYSIIKLSWLKKLICVVK